MKPIYTLIPLNEALPILGYKHRDTAIRYIKSGKIPKDWYHKNKMGKIWFKKEKILGLL